MPLKEVRGKGKKVEDNRDNYSYLYYKDTKLSDEIFRKGGLGGEFKDGYCELLHYRFDSSGVRQSFGDWVIVDTKGKIVFASNSTLDNVRHISGHIAAYKKLFYDLRNGKAIAPKNNTYFVGKKKIIFVHEYTFCQDMEFPLGIYSIDVETATKLDDVKK